MTRKIFSVFCFAVALFVSCGKESGTDEKEGSANLLCMTSEASGVTQTSAILNGTATIKNAKASNANAYFYYSTTQADAKTLKASGQRLSAGTIPNTGGDFSANLGSLSPATTYYYVASVSIDDQEELGGVKSFTTEKKTDSFSVTGAAIDITVNSATLTAYANLPADMTGDVTIGIIYSTSSSPSLQNGKLLTSKDLDGNNMYQVEATDLTPDTKYYFKSFLSRSNLNYYGEVKEFTTAQVLASVSTLDAWDVVDTKAMVGGKVEISSKGVLSKSAVIYYGADGTSADALKTKGKKVTIGAIDEDGSFKTELTSLTASTKYYYIAVVSVEGVEFAGSIKNFTTQDKPTEISVTGESSDIRESSAKLYGWCNQDGTEGLSVVFGIEYSATDLTTASTTLTASEKDTDNKYFCQATGLSSNTLYYYRAFTLFNGVRSYGEVKSFTTRDFTATVTTLEATDITEFRSSIRGSLSVSSTEDLNKSVWFLYSSTATTIDALKTDGTKITASLSNGSFSYNLSSLAYNTTYYYVAVAKVHDKEFYGEVKTFTTDLLHAIDMGTVVNGKSIKWASANIGARSPQSFGKYYSWGETETKYSYSWSTYKWCDGSSDSLKKYNNDISKGTVDNKTELDPEDDVAHVELGGNWRMPTDAEWTALLTQCTWTWTTQNGVFGRLVVASNGNSLFLPAASSQCDTHVISTSGSYWSSSLDTDNPYCAWSLNFFSGNVYRESNNRCYGFSIRPVLEE